MSNYIDYDYYVNTFVGELIPDDKFEKYAMLASSKIRNRIFNKDITGFEIEVKNATCFVAEILYNQSLNKEKLGDILSGKEKIITSEKIGDYSRNISNVSIDDLKKLISTENVDNEIENTIQDNLQLTGLLYCPIGVINV